MNLCLSVWRCQILLLSFIVCWLLPPVGCNIFQRLGSLTVKPASPFLMGSSLTVHCHIDKCQHQSEIYLDFEGKVVLPSKLVNCSAKFTLTNVQVPQSRVFCMRKDREAIYYVNGMNLRGGLPPDKPQNLSCETTRNSHFIDCVWAKEKETHVFTSYNISIKISNGSQIYFGQIHNKEKCSMPRGVFDEHTKYQLTIAAHNYFGHFYSDPYVFSLRDVVVPEIPYITHINFENDSLAAILQWKTSETFKNIKLYIRVRTANGSWKEIEGSELGESLVQVAGLRPLTDYEFQVKTCEKTLRLTDTNPPSVLKSVCSKWSLSFWKKTPGKGPSQPLHVWRDSVLKMENGLLLVTVLWKPPPSADYSGQVHRYEILLGNGQTQEETCPPGLSQCSAQVPLLKPISVSAVTSYGTSPPAFIPLTQSDASRPVLKEVRPAVNDSAVLVSWTSPDQEKDLLGYVTEWRTLPPTALHWQSLSKDQSNTTITGLNAGVRYNISLYAVTTRGVSAPSSSVVYSKELKPLSGPVMSVSVHEPNQILVQWDELAVDQRRGFITSYTIYYYVLDTGNSQLSLTVPGTAPRQMWLDCPKGTLGLQMTASTSAGEGPQGNLISSYPAAPPVGLVIVIIFIITFFIAIIVNLMCWKCVRKRIKQKCISWGPAWLGDNMPNMENSNAIKLLEQNSSEPSLFSSYSDPSLSPISFLSQEVKEELYPCVHVDSGPIQTDIETTFSSSLMTEHVSYKPHIAAFTFLDKEEITETDDDQSDKADMSSGQLEGFLGGLLSSVEVDPCDSPVQLNLDIVHGLYWPKMPPVVSPERRTSGINMDSESALLLMQQSEISTEETHVDLSHNSAEIMTSGYFPQVTHNLRQKEQHQQLENCTT